VLCGDVLDVCRRALALYSWCWLDAHLGVFFFFSSLVTKPYTLKHDIWVSANSGES
jgi:hypothetical protein